MTDLKTTKSPTKTKSAKPVSKAVSTRVRKTGTPLLAGQRKPSGSFRLPPKMAGAVEHCQKNAEAGVDHTTLARRFGPQAPTTLLLLGFLELGPDDHFRYAAAGDEWMDAHRKTINAPGSQKEHDLRGERERQAVILCQHPRGYDAVTKICGDVSTLFLIEEQLLQWVAKPGEKRLVWQGGKGQLQSTAL